MAYCEILAPRADLHLAYCRQQLLLSSAIRYRILASTEQRIPGMSEVIREFSVALDERLLAALWRYQCCCSTDA